MSYFQFKQFTIQQSRCALKVCTDACLFGAWTSTLLQEEKRILDIGSGTGLLMLMLAQNSQAGIDGIEIDPASAEQSMENITISPWKDRLKIIQGDARSFDFGNKYDLIISNPPFFENDLPSHSKQEQVAKHSTSLKLEELLQLALQWLDDNGRLALLLPYHRMTELKLATEKQGLYLQQGLLAKQTPRHTPFRWMGVYSRTPNDHPYTNELIIQETSGSYTAQFRNYLSPYYLKL